MSGKQYSDPSYQIVPGDYLSSSPGSGPAGTGSGAGSVIGSSVVSADDQSSQVPANNPVVAVHAGSTYSGSSGDPAAGAIGGPRAEYLDTGAGKGNPNQNRHPNGGQ